MNVFRRFAVDRAKMIEFYGEVLGLKQLPSIQLGGGNEMILFAIGTGRRNGDWTVQPAGRDPNATRPPG